MPPTVSLITTTYNWPAALEAVLASVAKQQILPQEVVIADDGSKRPTRELIEQVQKDFPCPIKHIWHEDHGHRASKIRNKAVAESDGDYLVFLDSDCVLRPDFIAQHARLARPGHFIAGNRVLLSEDYTRQVIEQRIDLTHKHPFSFTRDQVNRRWSMLRIPMGALRNLQARSWKNAKSCNMSMFRSDFIHANGFEESYEGWGYEDSDLVVRLLNNGVRRISGRFATTVYHLWHNTNKSPLEQGNWRRLQETVEKKHQIADIGVKQYL